PDPDYAIFFSQFGSSSQGGNDLIQLGSFAFRTMLDRLTERLFSLPISALTAQKLRANQYC
ncbi:MAG: hypothetical protein ACFFCW_46505, partial [Candidatus Hodarchaeota archaeon]